MNQRLDFSFKNNEDGYFEDGEYPQQPGRYRYMPYRGFGHYELGLALKKGPATCSFADKGSVFEFTVTAIPTQGVLEIDSIVSRHTAEPSSGRTCRCSSQSRRSDISVQSSGRLGGGLAAERQTVRGQVPWYARRFRLEDVAHG